MCSEEAPPGLGRNGLEVDENPRLQAQTWFVQRIAWGVFALVVSLALAGATGDGGIWADQTTRMAGLEVTTARVMRQGNAEQIRVVAPPGPLTLDLDAAFLAAFEILSVEPQPLVQQSRQAGLRLELSGSGTQPTMARLKVAPLSVGFATVGLASGDASVFLSPLTLP